MERAPGQLKKKTFTFDASNDTIPRWTVESDRRRLLFIARRRDLFYVGARPNDKKTCFGVGILERATGQLKKKTSTFDASNDTIPRWTVESDRQRLFYRPSKEIE